MAISNPINGIHSGAAKAWQDYEKCRIQAEQWELDENKKIIEQQVTDLVAKYGGTAEGIRLLDIGCGNGRFALCCSYEIYLGIDQSLPMILLAREVLDATDKKAAFIQAPAFSFVLGEFWHIGIVIHVIQHVEEPYEFLRNLKKHYSVGFWIFTVLVNFSDEPRYLNIEDELAAVALPKNEVIHKISEVFAIEEMIELPGVGVEEVTEILFVGRP